MSYNGYSWSPYFQTSGQQNARNNNQSYSDSRAGNAPYYRHLPNNASNFGQSGQQQPQTRPPSNGDHVAYAYQEYGRPELTSRETQHSRPEHDMGARDNLDTSPLGSLAYASALGRQHQQVEGTESFHRMPSATGTNVVPAYGFSTPGTSKGHHQAQFERHGSESGTRSLSYGNVHTSDATSLAVNALAQTEHSAVQTARTQSPVVSHSHLRHTLFNGQRTEKVNSRAQVSTGTPQPNQRPPVLVHDTQSTTSTHAHNAPMTQQLSSEDPSRLSYADHRGDSTNSEGHSRLNRAHITNYSPTSNGRNPTIRQRDMIGQDDESRMIKNSQHSATVNPNQVFNPYEYQRRKAAMEAEAEAARAAQDALQGTQIETLLNRPGTANGHTPLASRQSSDVPGSTGTPGGLPQARARPSHAIQAGEDKSQKDHIEAEMKLMLEKMREYRAMDPTLFSQIWEQVKRDQPPVRPSSQAPPTAEDCAQTSITRGGKVVQSPAIDGHVNGQLPSPSPTLHPQLSTAEATTVELPDLGKFPAQRRKRKSGMPQAELFGQSVSRDAHPQESARASSVRADVPDHVAGDAQQADNSNSEQRGVAVPSGQPQITTAASRSAAVPIQNSFSGLSSGQSSQGGTIWPENRKSSLAAAAQTALMSSAANAGKHISSNEIRTMLDQSPSYAELCEAFETRGFALNRSDFARFLLAAVPDVSSSPVAAAPASNTLKRSHGRPGKDRSSPQKPDLGQIPAASQANSFPSSNQGASQDRSTLLPVDQGVHMNAETSVKSTTSNTSARQSVNSPAQPLETPLRSSLPSPNHEIRERGNTLSRHLSVQSVPWSREGPLDSSLTSSNNQMREHHKVPSDGPSQKLIPQSREAPSGFSMLVPDVNMIHSTVQQNFTEGRARVAQPSSTLSSTPITDGAQTSSTNSNPNVQPTSLGKRYSLKWPQKHSFKQHTVPPSMNHNSVLGPTNRHLSNVVHPGFAPLNLSGAQYNPSLNKRGATEPKSKSNMIHSQVPAKTQTQTLPTSPRQNLKTTPPTKEELARKRSFNDIVDLTQDLSDDEVIRQNKRLRLNDSLKGAEGGSFHTRTSGAFKIPTIDMTTNLDPQIVNRTRNDAIHTTQRPLKKASARKSGTSTPVGHGSKTDLAQYKHAPTDTMSKREAIRNEVAVQSLDKKKALRRSTYDPKTIARDVLISTGRHPSERPLNWHLEGLRTIFRGVSNNSDLSTFPWDLVDPDGPSAEGQDADDEVDVQVNLSHPVVRRRRARAAVTNNADVEMVEMVDQGDEPLQSLKGLRLPDRGSGSGDTNHRGRGRRSRGGSHILGPSLSRTSLPGSVMSNTGNRMQRPPRPESHHTSSTSDSARNTSRPQINHSSASHSQTSSSNPSSQRETISSMNNADLSQLDAGESSAGVSFAPAHGSAADTTIPRRTTANNSMPPPISPLNSVTSSKRRGPPRGSINKSPSTDTDTDRARSSSGEPKRRGRPPGLKNATSTKVQTSSSGVQVAIPVRARHDSTTPLRPSRLRNTLTPSDGILVVMPARSPSIRSISHSERKRSSASNEPAKRRRGRPSNTPPSDPNYKVYRCCWKDCKAELHNLETLRKHVQKLHCKKSDQGNIPCLWRGCDESEGTKHDEASEQSNTPHNMTFPSEALWSEHMEKHLEPLAWELGDGPSTHPSDAETSDYLSDTQGRRMTPLVNAEGPGDPLHLGSDRRPARAYHKAHGNTTELEKATALFKACEARKRAIGPGMEHSGSTFVTPGMRALLKDDAFSLRLVREEEYM